MLVQRDEQVAKIIGFDGYAVDTKGRVYSCRVRNGRGRRGPWRRLKLSTDKDGYKVVSMQQHGERLQRRVNRLVAQAFLEDFYNDCVVMHRNNKRDDNNVENLKVGTHLENNRQAFREGRNKKIKGEEMPWSKLNEHQVRRIRLMKEVDPGITHKAIAGMFGVCRATISQVLSGKNWKHIQ